MVENTRHSLSRRGFVWLAAMAAFSHALALNLRARSVEGRRIRLFDGKTLKGWRQIENNAITFSTSQLHALSSSATSLGRNTFFLILDRFRSSTR